MEKVNKNYMIYEEARKKVKLHIQELSIDEDHTLVVIEEMTIEKDFGWVFFYNSKKYLETQSFSDMIVGNAPILISRKDGAMHETGTAEPVEYYVENFEKYGRCYP
jgi:hypothetical protein